METARLHNRRFTQTGMHRGVLMDGTSNSSTFVQSSTTRLSTVDPADSSSRDARYTVCGTCGDVVSVSSSSSCSCCSCCCSCSSCSSTSASCSCSSSNTSSRPSKSEGEADPRRGTPFLSSSHDQMPVAMTAAAVLNRLVPAPFLLSLPPMIHSKLHPADEHTPQAVFQVDSHHSIAAAGDAGRDAAIERVPSTAVLGKWPPRQAVCTFVQTDDLPSTSKAAPGQQSEITPTMNPIPRFDAECQTVIPTEARGQQTDDDGPSKGDTGTCTGLDDVGQLFAQRIADAAERRLLHDELVARSSIQQDGYELIFLLQSLAAAFLRQEGMHGLRLQIQQMDHQASVHMSQRAAELSLAWVKLTAEMDKTRQAVEAEWMSWGMETGVALIKLSALVVEERYNAHRVQYEQAIVDAEDLRSKLAVSVAGEAMQRQRLLRLLKEPSSALSSGDRVEDPSLIRGLDLRMSVHERFARAHQQAVQCVTAKQRYHHDDQVAPPTHA